MPQSERASRFRFDQLIFKIYSRNFIVLLCEIEELQACA